MPRFGGAFLLTGNRDVEEARRDVANVRLFTRNGIDWSGRFPLIVQAIGSCLIDGEAIAYDDDSPSFRVSCAGAVTTAW